MLCYKLLRSLSSWATEVELLLGKEMFQDRNLCPAVEIQGKDKGIFLGTKWETLNGSHVHVWPLTSTWVALGNPGAYIYMTSVHTPYVHLKMETYQTVTGGSFILFLWSVLWKMLLWHKIYRNLGWWPKLFQVNFLSVCPWSQIFVRNLIKMALLFSRNHKQCILKNYKFYSISLLNMLGRCQSHL